jgi:hypothetical protein
MSPERLAQIKAHFTNPPSASCNAEWALEVIAALEALMPRAADPAIAAMRRLERDPAMVAAFSDEPMEIKNPMPPNPGKPFVQSDAAFEELMAKQVASDPKLAAALAKEKSAPKKGRK